MESIAGKIEKELIPLGKQREMLGLPGITIAVMGCEVNGPGEAGSRRGSRLRKRKGCSLCQGKIGQNRGRERYHWRVDQTGRGIIERQNEEYI